MTNPGKGRLLHITLIAGLILLVSAVAGLTIFYIISRASANSQRQEGFFGLLDEYDASLPDFFGTEREYDQLHAALDRLEKKAISVESWLSVLKRRRALALKHRPSLANYHKSIDNALAAYPASQPIAAIAAAALVKDSAITNEEEIKLRELLPLLKGGLPSPSYNTLRLSLHILLGDFRSPQRAAAVSQDITTDGTEAITVDLAILKILRGDRSGAMADMQTMINREQMTDNSEQLAEDSGQLTEDIEQLTENGGQLTEDSGQLKKNAERVSDKGLRFAAEVYYDFGDLWRSAEIFSLINETSAMSRQADALYLAGFEESAVNIWNMLAQTGGSDSQIVTSLYNLAVIALEQNDGEKAALFLEKLYNTDSSNKDNHVLNSRQFGLIRYSRLFELPRGAAILQSNKSFPYAKYPYIDLEICKRLSHEWNLNRQTAETWLLLDRHSKNEELYRWAAWHFYFQRRFDEIPILIDRFNMLRYSSSWVNFYKALLWMNGGDLQKAESILLSIPETEAGWHVNANLGRIYEEMHSQQRALRQYEEAVSKYELSIYHPAAKSPAQNKKAAARIYQRMAKCYIAVSLPNEALKALLQAIELDPENLSIRLELERLMY